MGFFAGVATPTIVGRERFGEARFFIDARARVGKFRDFAFPFLSDMGSPGQTAPVATGNT
jgi:hypothetical protein